MKNKKNYSIELPPLHLYRDDLNDIETILRSELGVRKCEVSFDDYEVESFEDIPENHKPTDNFSIQTHSPYISIDIGRWSSVVYVANYDNLTIRGGVEKIKAILIKRARRRVSKLRKALSISSSIVAILLTLFLVTAAVLRDIIDLVFIVLIFLLIILFVYVSIRLFPTRSIVEFSFESKKKGFWQRNKDQIILIVISAAVGAIITLTLTYFFRNIAG